MTLDIGSWAQAAVSGTMLLAIPVALLAGLVSFFSPCVVPLLPGYVSFATGMSAADAAKGDTNRGRLLLGMLLFVLGFGVVFVGVGVLIGAVGQALLVYQKIISRVIGAVIIAMGLIFAGLLPIGRREIRLQRLPTVGIAGAPLLGVVFGLGWTPCIGPTLSVVLTLAMNEGSAVRGGILAFVYTLGLGIPFVAAGLALSKMTRTLSFVRRHHLAMIRLGGALMVLVGLLLTLGIWDQMIGVMRQWASGFGTVI